MLNTHLDPSGDDRWRRQEADSVVSLAAQARRGERLVIVGGDFNSTPESDVQKQVRAGGLRDACDACDAWELCWGNMMPSLVWCTVKLMSSTSPSRTVSASS